VATSAGKSELCTEVIEDVTRDQCYIDFALRKNQFDVCEKITNRYLRGSCNSLRNLRMLEKAVNEARLAPTTVPEIKIEEGDENTVSSGETACGASRPAECGNTISMVCADDRKTYSNSCQACMNANVTAYSTGACV
jgi:hypothetical protein